jgi:exopolysaccharide production protein ExoZ
MQVGTSEVPHTTAPDSAGLGRSAAATLERAEKPKSSSRLDGVQAARGVAALAVVVTHSIAHPLGGEGELTLLLGLYGVALFFVISGYIMVRTTGTGAFDPFAFMNRRIRRIVPLYYIASAALALAAAVLPYSFKTTTLDSVHIFKSLLFIPNYSPRAPNEIIPFYKLGWTLNQEMFFYVVFAALSFLSARGRVWILTVFFGLLVVAGRILTIEAAIPKFYTYPIIIGFVLGMWLARFSFSTDWHLSRPLAKALFIASLVSLLGIAWNHHMYVTNEVVLIGWLCATAAVQLAVVVFYVDRGGARVHPWAIAAGDASYSLYLFHMFAIAGTLVIVAYLLPGQLALAILLAAVSAVACGLVVYRYVEATLIEWLKPASTGRLVSAAPRGDAAQ